jgi:hypothetical protein
LPVPARPTTSATPWPPWQTSRTMPAWAVRAAVGWAPSAARTASWDATAVCSPARSPAATTSRCSTASSSGVDQRRSSSARSATTATARSARNRSASSSSWTRVAPASSPPRAAITSWRAKVDACAVNPAGPASRSNASATGRSDRPCSRSRVRPVTWLTRASASTPRSAASARQRSYSVSGRSCCLVLRVAWTAHCTSLGVRDRPAASSRSTSRSIWSLRLENARTRSSGIPWSSRLPCRSAAVHSTPSVRTSSRW